MLIEIDCKIYTLRGVKIILDHDLSELYGVEPKRLNESIKRNIERFPGDFMFRLTIEDVAHLRSQYPAREFSSKTTNYAFTENGVAMLSSVLNSREAIQINIAIMRIFTKLKSFHALEAQLSRKVENLEESTRRMFKIVFERLDSLEEIPSQKPDRKIGLK